MPQVSGRVVDTSGAPAPGVFVYAVPAAGARFGKAPGTHSRRDGGWSLELSAGEWTVRETGHASYTVGVGALPTDFTAPAVTAPATAPTRDDLARFLRRRRSTREDA